MKYKGKMIGDISPQLSKKEQKLYKQYSILPVGVPISKRMVANVGKKLKIKNPLTFDEWSHMIDKNSWCIGDDFQKGIQEMYKDVYRREVLTEKQPKIYYI